MTQAYCMKCRKKVEVRGECPSCGTKVFRIGKA